MTSTRNPEAPWSPRRVLLARLSVLASIPALVLAVAVLGRWV